MERKEGLGPRGHVASGPVFFPWTSVSQEYHELGTEPVGSVKDSNTDILCLRNI